VTVLPSFVICLREGLEAALIVGIIAAFLGSQGRRDALRQVWIGVGAAVTLCLAVGIGLSLLSRDLPQKQQEGLETIIGLLAVGLVTYMILWMRGHARGLKRHLEGATAGALATGSTRALVVMAFLAVLREGFETAVFLLGLFNESTISTGPAVAGGLLGLDEDGLAELARTAVRASFAPEDVRTRVLGEIDAYREGAGEK